MLDVIILTTETKTCSQESSQMFDVIPNIQYNGLKWKRLAAPSILSGIGAHHATEKQVHKPTRKHPQKVHNMINQVKTKKQCNLAFF